jgi:hypothetical protein
VVAFRPKVAVMLNLTPDHLDRHGSLEVYAGLKARVFARQGAGDLAVLNADDPDTVAWAGRFGLGAQVAYIRRGEKGLAAPLEGPLADAIAHADGAWVDREDRIVRAWEGHKDVLLPVAQLRVPGPHNVSNALAAVAATLPFGAKAKDLAKALAAFPGLAHRLEPLGEDQGIAFYNDSKATNVDSMRTALAAFPGPLVVIAGGRDKKGDWGSLESLAGDKIGRLVLIGEAAETIARAWRRVPSVRASDLDDAARKALAAAKELGGSPVVLSPGCASFDMFEDFEDRGERLGSRPPPRREGGAMTAIRRADPFVAFVPLVLACSSLVLVYWRARSSASRPTTTRIHFLTRRAVHLVIGLVAFWCARASTTTGWSTAGRVAASSSCSRCSPSSACCSTATWRARGAGSTCSARRSSRPRSRRLVVLFLARFLARKGEAIKNLKTGFLPALWSAAWRSS